ncbi:MAG: hypothetical protein Q8R91_10605 [Candidatus Omnitrophota bacterium]|nr:hypothetical protein [Candidatus Omnitrophota bacterium]
MLIGEWSIWPSVTRDTENLAAYVIAALIGMDHAGVTEHAFTSMIEQDSTDAALQFQAGNASGYGIVTKDLVVKPVYNAFQALSLAAGKPEGHDVNRLALTAPQDEFVAALATQTNDRKTTRTLMANFVPATRRMTSPYLGTRLRSCLRSKGYSQEEYESLCDALRTAATRNRPQRGVTLESVKRLVQEAVSDPNTRQDLRWCVEHDVLAMKQAIDRYRNEPREISLVVSGLATGSYRVRRYLIDADHANSCRYNKRTEPQPTNTSCGVNGDIDQRVARAKADATREGRRAAFASLRAQGYTERDLESGTQVVRSCKRKMACVQETLANSYQQLNRCTTPDGAPPRCLSADTVIGELKTAIGIYRDTSARVFFYDSPDAVDKINNLPEVRLDVVEERTVSVQDGAFREALTVTPNAVWLVEIERL